MILILDDEPHYIQAYIDIIEDAGLVLEVVTTPTDFFQSLSFATKVVIIDVMLPEGINAGLATFRAMHRNFPYSPAIFLTNRVDFDLGWLDDRTLAVSKRDILPQELLDMIKNVMLSGVRDKWVADGLNRRLVSGYTSRQS